MDHQLRSGLADRYAFGREVGRGAMATVYRVHDLKHDRPVAIKVLDSQLAETVGPGRFLREIKLAARLQHPHILPVYDSGETAGYLWFTMPFVAGESLGALLRRKRRLPFTEAIPLACEAADALDFAHRHGVLHRDIKPDNILLSEGHALVADFGVARAVDTSREVDFYTDPGFVVGTPTYMAPEQAMGDPVDHRCDVYALGIVVFEMIAGALPYAGSTTEMLEAKRTSGESDRRWSIGPAAPEPVERVVLKALAPDPAERFQTAADFSRALREALLASAGWRPPPGFRMGRRRIPMALILGLGLLLGGGGLFAWHRISNQVAAVSPPQRIAVLPFENLNTAEDEYFAEGVTDDLRGKLAALPGMQVTARSSSGRYGKGDKSPEEIGRELGVEFLLMGTVRWEKANGTGDRVLVVPELVDVTTGLTRWQQTFEAPITDVFEVQGNIAGRVAQALDIALGAAQRIRLGERPTRDLAAYDLFLRGRHAFYRRTAAGLAEARDWFERAIGLDPEFALAYAGLADVYVVLPFWEDVPASQTHPQAIAAATQAISLDSTLGGAHAALADARALYEWDWSAAEEGFRKALALDPNNANTHQWYGQDVLMPMGRWDEALAECRRARELDPLSLVYGTTLAQTLATLGRPDEALALADEVERLDPNFPVVQETRGRVYLNTGRHDSAVASFEENLAESGRRAMTLALLGYAYTKVDRREEAERLLEELELAGRTSYSSATAVAILHAALGDTTAAFQWLEAAAQERDPFLIYFFVIDPILAGLREDPRGVALLTRMNLAPGS